MSEPFDILTIACFLIMVVAYFAWSSRDIRTLLHLSICAIVLATANHLGNNGWPIFAIILIFAAVGYGFLILTGRDQAREE